MDEATLSAELIKLRGIGEASPIFLTCPPPVQLHHGMPVHEADHTQRSTLHLRNAFWIHSQAPG